MKMARRKSNSSKFIHISSGRWIQSVRFKTALSKGHCAYSARYSMFNMASLQHYTPTFGDLPAMDLINVTHDGRTLQMRPDQLTISVLSKAFRLIPETIFLVSDRGTIAVAEDGVFQDVDELYTWSVGEKATVGSSRPLSRASSGESSQSQSRWKPTAFQASRLTRNVSPTNIMSACKLG